MNTLNKENSKTLILLAIAVLFFNISNAFSSELSARKAMQQTYQLPETITPQQAGQMVDLLKKESANIRNSYLLARIQYRQAIIYYKASMFDKAAEILKNVTDKKNFPPYIKAASYNISAIISKQQGDYNSAIDKFNQLAQLVIDDRKLTEETSPAMLKLASLALFNVAQMYQTQENTPKAIDAYGRLLSILYYSRQPQFRKYVPIAKDKLAQLYFATGHTKKYFALCDAIIVDYPNYYRYQLIKFEIDCIKILQQLLPNKPLPKYSTTAPSQLIKLIKEAAEKQPFISHSEKLKTHIDEQQNDYSQLLIKYYCSWLFDATGQKQKALEILNSIQQSKQNKTNFENLGNVSESIYQYSKIFQSLILTEFNKHNEALELINSIQENKNDLHASKLITAMQKSINTLKRESKYNANK